MDIFQIPTRYFSPTFRLIFCTKMDCFQTKPYFHYIRGWTFSISAYFVCFDLKNIIILTVFLKNSSFYVEKYQILKITFFSFHIIKKARHLDVTPTPNATLRCRILYSPSDTAICRFFALPDIWSPKNHNKYIAPQIAVFWFHHPSSTIPPVSSVDRLAASVTGQQFPKLRCPKIIII